MLTGQRLQSTASRPQRTQNVWWMGCHGGAGVTTLMKLTGYGIDGGRQWPRMPIPPHLDVVMVCRASALGTGAASATIDSWLKGGRQIPVLGLVVIPNSPRRVPHIVAQRLDLIKGWIPNVWKVAWHEAYGHTDHPDQIGRPPSVEALRHFIVRAKATQSPHLPNP